MPAIVETARQMRYRLCSNFEAYAISLSGNNAERKRHVSAMSNEAWPIKGIALNCQAHSRNSRMKTGMAKVAVSFIYGEKLISLSLKVYYERMAAA